MDIDQEPKEDLMMDIELNAAENTTATNVNPAQNITSDTKNPNETLPLEIRDPNETTLLASTSPGNVSLHEPSQKDTDSSTADLHVNDNANNVEHQNSSSQEAITEACIEESTNPQISYGRLNFQNEPMLYTKAWTEFCSTPDVLNNFTKGCKWSPDGLCVLTNSADNCLRLFDLPQAFYSTENTDLNNLPEMSPSLKIKESDTVYDFCWYPLMKSSDPTSCLFVSTSRLNPVHAWDAFTGQLRASYKAYNNVDEMVAAVSVAFDPFGTKLYCGFNKSIRVFDFSVPGRECYEYFTKAQGQSGIISCIAVNPANSKQFAAGSYLRTIALYNEPKGIQEMFLEGQIGGVTQLMFSPDGTKLYSGARKDPNILCWDLRFPDKVLCAMQREVKTNQRIYFDIDNSGRYLLSGGTDGVTSIWDLTKPIDTGIDELQILDPIINFQAQNDCVNGVSFSPIFPMFTTTSGQRKYREPVESENETEDEDLFTNKHINYDNSLCLWWAGHSENNE